MKTTYIDSNGNLVSSNSGGSSKNTYTYIDNNGNLASAEVPIAPLPKKKKKKDTNDWFQESEGNTIQTVAGTTADLGYNAFVGPGKKMESWENSLLYWLGDVFEGIGLDSASKIAKKNAGQSRIDNSLKPIEEIIEPNSVLGERTDELTQNITGTAYQAVLTSAIPGGTVGQTAASSAMMFSEGYSNARTQALNEGATEEEAKAYGNIAGLSEAATELMFGGLGKFNKALGFSKSGLPVDDIVATNFSQLFKSRLAKNLAEYGVKAAGEGFEEVASGVLQAIGKKLTYKKEEDIQKLINDEDLLNSFIDGAIVSGIMQIPGENGVINATKNDKDFVSGYTTNEQNLVDKIVDTRIKEAEEKDEKVSKGDIKKAVEEDLENGDIDINDIEKALGGDNYKQYQEVLDKYNELQTKVDEYKKMKDNDITVEQREEYNKLKEELSNQTKTVDKLGKELSQYVYETTKNDELIRKSYDEYFKKGQAYQIDPDKKYSEKQMEQIKRAMDSGLINNTTRMHQLMDNISQIHEDKGVLFNFVDSKEATEHAIEKEIQRYMKENNITELSEEQRKELYRQYEDYFKDKTINGYVENGEVYLNVDSAKYLNAVMGHEITHLFEGDSKLYKNLRKEVLEFAKTKGEYAERLKQLGKDYEKIDSDIETELVNDIIGDYLFTDEEFVRKLSTNKNIFQKIYDEIKYLAKVITGRKEQAQIQKMKNMFEKVYRETTLNQNNNTQYSIAGIQGIKNLSDSKFKRDALNAYNEAQKLSNQKVDNEKIRQKTKWFQDKNGDWKFEIDDSSITLDNNLIQKNGKYKLGEIINHNMIFKLYPELINYEVKFDNMKPNGAFYRGSNLIKINNKFIKNADFKELKGTLLHEIQHAIQKIEGFERGMSSRLSKEAYYNKLGEIEADNTKLRYMNNMNKEDRMLIAPESSKENPKHSKYDEYMKNRNIIDKTKDNLYPIIDRLINGSEKNVNNEDISKNQRQDSNMVVGRELDNSSFSNTKYSITQDSQGRELSKQQQKYFKDSKVRDENGRLMEVYHGTNNNFNEFTRGNGEHGKGFYFTDDYNYAEEYTDNRDYYDDRDGGVKETYLNITNPLFANVDINSDSMKNLMNNIENKWGLSKQEIIDCFNNYDWSAELSSKIAEKMGYGKEDVEGIVGWEFDEPEDLGITDYKAYLGSYAWKNGLNQLVRDSGFDGIIAPIYNSDTEGMEYIAFNSNQIKNIDNTNPTSDPDIRYSISETGNTGNLMAIHNLSEDKLKGILELGGFPVPSIAITSADKTGQLRYGNITVLFDKNTINPQVKENEVYSSDIYSSRFPALENKINDNVINDLVKKSNYELSYQELKMLAEENRFNADRVPEDLMKVFFNDKGIEWNEQNRDYYENNDDGYNEYSKWVNDLSNQIIGEKRVVKPDVDYYTPSGNIRSIEQRTLPYTLENVVKIMTKKSTKGSEGNGWTGTGEIRGNLSPELKSIEEIKQNENKLITTEEMEQYKNKIEDDFSKITDKLGQYYKYKDTNSYYVLDTVADSINETAKAKKVNAETLKSKLAENFIEGVPDEVLNETIDFLNSLKNAPTEYFEAKPQRAVGLDEVQAIVIPNNTSTDFKKQLQDIGLNYVEYDPNIEGDRQRVINQFDDLKFSISNKNEDLAPIGNYHIKGEDIKLQDIAPIETMQEETKTETPSEEIELPFDEDELPFEYEAPLEINGLDDKTINKITKNLKSELSLNPYEVKEFKNILSDISKDDSITKEGITNLLEKKFGEKELKVKIEEIENIKKELRNTKIFVPDYVKVDIPDYSDFRQRNYGKINFSKEGMAVDKVYDELVEMHQEYFDKDITNEADQLQEIARVASLDKYITDTAYLDESKIKNAAEWIYDSIEDYTLQQEVKNGTLGYDEYLEKSKQKELKKTRKIVQNELQDEMEITVSDLDAGKDISALGYQRTDPIRLNEKVFGAEVGKKINDATIRKTNHNEAERTRFLNKEREEIKNLGIKARSEESAAVQKYGEKQYVNDKGELLPYGDKELAREFSDKATQDKIKNAARVLRNKYDVYIDEINKAITEMGYDPIPKRKDYMRHFQEINDKLSEWGVPLNQNDLSKDTLPTDINGITDQFKPGKNWFASAMERKGLKTTYDAITGIDGYLEGASNLIYHTGDIQRYRTLSKMIRDTYGQSHGLDNVDLDTKEGQKRLNDIFDNKLSKYAAWLDEQANALAGKKGGIDRAAERLLGRKIYTIADTAKKQVGSNMTGFNVRSAMTNFASAVQGASKTNKLSFLKGTISTIKNMINNDGLIEKSDFLTNRFGSDTLSKKLWQKASNAGQILMTGTDYFTANQIWRSKYFENLSKGMNETEAIKAADDFASRIMGDRSKGMTAELFNSKTLGLLTQFQLEVNNQWSSIMHDNKMDVQRGNKSGAAVMFQLGQLAAMSYMFNNFMKSVTGSDVMIDPIDILKELFGWNDDEDEETTLEQRSQKVLGDIVNNLPFASFMTGGRIPISEAFTGAETAFKKLTGQTDKYGNDIKWEDVKDDVISSAAYWLLPTGYGQIKKTTKGLSMYDDDLPLPGSYTNSGNLRFTADNDTESKIKAALFGEYSSEEARKYRESGYQTIDAKSVDLLKKLNMNSSEFRKFESKKNAATETTTTKDGVKYTKYVDENENVYWYNKDNKKLYTENFNPSAKDVTELNKVNSNELLFDFISNSYFTEKQKQELFNEYFKNTTTDQYGYEKYKDSDNKVYWYDKDTKTLYDSKYNKVSNSKLNSLYKVNNVKDMSNYNDYGSYEEADYAIKNPGKYMASKVITNNYKTYKKYLDDLSNISSDKNVYGKTIPNSKKKKVVNYINDLNEDYGSKLILYKMEYPSDNSYNTEIVKYLNGLEKITYEEEKTILKELGMKITDDGTVRW